MPVKSSGTACCSELSTLGNDHTLLRAVHGASACFLNLLYHIKAFHNLQSKRSGSGMQRTCVSSQTQVGRENITSPNTTCLPSSHGVAIVQRKNLHSCPVSQKLRMQQPQHADELVA